jgi:predicted RNase H-like HicB family nuclease
MADGQAFAAVMPPDLEDAGFSVKCREIVGAVSQGETEQEALGD